MTRIDSSTEAATLATQNYVQQLEQENFRLKVGLGVGLGGGLAVTTGLAIASYVYFSQR